jgi:signal transduction histidine kinase
VGLIERVREYAMLGRDLQWQPVDLEALAAEVIRTLAPPAGVEIVVEGPLPTVRGDRDRLATAFGHLLGNAVKFMDKPGGKVRVTAERVHGGWQLSVTDNGPGIEAQFLEAIFKPGKTLAPQDEVEGSGMGLALARKIVELHGGRIWAESTVGQGTTLRFTLAG